MAGIGITTLQNPAYRAMLKLPDNNLGAKVDRLRPGSNAAEVLRPDDVILRVGEYSVASDATILYEGNRAFCGLAFQLGQSGDSIPVEIWRDGKSQVLSVKAESNADDSSEGNQFDLQPRYYVFGGLVFTPLSLDYMRDAGRDNSDGSGAELTYELFYRTREQPQTARDEPVVLSSLLSDEVNANFTVRGYQLVDRINGIRIDKLEDVIRAFETSTNAYDRIDFGRRGVFECLNHADAVKTAPAILKTYGVPRDRHL